MQPLALREGNFEMTDPAIDSKNNVGVELNIQYKTEALPVITTQQTVDSDSVVNMFG